LTLTEMESQTSLLAALPVRSLETTTARDNCYRVK